MKEDGFGALGLFLVAFFSDENLWWVDGCDQQEKGSSLRVICIYVLYMSSETLTQNGSST